MDTIAQTKAHTMDTYNRSAVVLDEGHGAECRTEEGARLIDFGSGIGVNSLGFADEAWAEAVSAQARRLQHTSNLFYQQPQAALAEKLCRMTGYQKIFFGNSGAEANECAIKLARKYSFDKYGKGRHTILTLENSFHGRTLATLAATGQEEFHQYFFPFPEGFRHVRANDVGDLLRKADETVCAVMIEYVQGEGGVLPLTAEFAEKIRALCDENDWLMIADEVQTGIGRTGKMLVGEHYGLKADVTTVAKGLGGGLPIGACLANEKCARVLTAGTHGSTFGGNPVVCAGALQVLDRLAQPGMLDAVAEKGQYLRHRLESLDEVEEVTGLGLMLGIALKQRNAGEVRETCLKEGLLVLTAKDRIRLLPPLTISQTHLKTGADILCSVLGG